MRNAKIQVKLIAGFVVTTLLAGLVGFVGIAALTTSAANTALLNERTNMAIMSARLESIIHQQRAAYRGATVHYAFGMTNRFASSISELDILDQNYIMLHDELCVILITNEGKQLLGESGASHDDYIYKRNKLLNMLRVPDINSEEIAQAMEELTDSVRTLVDTHALLTDFINRITDEQALQALSSATRITAIMIIVIAAALVTSLSFSVYISRIVAQPLSMMEHVLVQIGDVGNLNFSEEQIAALKKEGAYKDEVGQSINAFTRMTERLLYLGHSLDLIAGGQMEVDIEPLSSEDTMGHALRRMVSNLNSIFNDMRNVEADLRLARTVAEESVKAKGDFLANMSHEIRTPMNGVLGLLHLVAQTELTEKQQEYIRKAGVSAQNLLRIINDILDFSKIEAGKMEMEFIEFSLKEIFEEIDSMFASKLCESSLTFNILLPHDLPDTIIGDPLRLKQVLINLIANAIKFTQTGEINVQVQELEAESGHLRFEFSVQDTGIGMTCEQMGNLFTPFTQADTSITRKFGGTGLGLTICKNLVGMMDGEIWVESTVGEGSTFHFASCFISPPSEQPNRPCEEEIAPVVINSNIVKGRILLVEDNEINQFIAQELLMAAGYLVDIANNGQMAIDMLESGQYELVLMDIQMPVMDGLTATKKIRENPAHRNLPIIAMSAHAMVSDIEKSLDSGMNDHLTKPVNPELLYSSLEKWLKKD